MLLKLVYLLVRRILGLAVLLFRGEMAKDAQLLVLRRENSVVRRRVGRVRYELADRGRVNGQIIMMPDRAVPPTMRTGDA